jgi:cytochrome c biogenesis protein CcmG, thiol:disulfide interchange protein DsbE
MKGDSSSAGFRPRSGAAGDAPPQSTLAALGLVLVLLAGFALLPRLLRRHDAAGVGREAPNFALALVANGASLGERSTGTLSLSELRGRAVLLDFWATWCQPCRLQAPIVDRLARRWRERGVVVVGVNTDTPDQGDPGSYAVAHGLSYPIVHDDVGVASRAYGIEELPTVVVLSRTGKIVAVRTGITSDAELERLVQQAL